jgi:hypothetical protein
MGIATDSRGLRCGGSAQAPGHDSAIGQRKLVSDIGHNGNEVRCEVAGCGAVNKPGFDNFPTQPPVCGGDDGLPTKLDGITFPKWRNESIKAYGNAIVPQVAYQIFKAIQAYEEL